MEKRALAFNSGLARGSKVKASVMGPGWERWLIYTFMMM